MCGIAGIVYKDGKIHNVGEDMTKMLNALQHRGPDSAGFSLYGHPFYFSLGSLRLSGL